MYSVSTAPEISTRVSIASLSLYHVTLSKTKSKSATMYDGRCGLQDVTVPLVHRHSVRSLCDVERLVFVRLAGVTCHCRLLKISTHSWCPEISKVASINCVPRFFFHEASVCAFEREINAFYALLQE